MARTHGAHHVPQNSTITTLPANSFGPNESGTLSHDFAVTGGAASPTFGTPGASATGSSSDASERIAMRMAAGLRRGEARHLRDRTPAAHPVRHASVPQRA